MFIPKAVLGLFKFNLDEQQSIRVDLAVAQAKVVELERSLAHTRSSFDWLRTRVNDLEYQNKALLEKAYNIRVPAPQIDRQYAPPADLREFGFNDLGDDFVKKFAEQVSAE